MMTLPTVTFPIPCVRQPVIILGMHRSGTSMISELLDHLGLFVGKTLQDDHESTFFLDLNDQLLNRVNASWDYPLPFREFLAMPAAVEMTTAALAADLTGRRGRKFFGARSVLAVRSFESFDKPWGWKDPRTVFTLPLWLKLFPGAKLIYITRHGVDVASSLFVREQMLLRRRQERFSQRLGQRSSRSALDRAGYKGSIRCLTLAGAFSLWREYVTQADDMLATLPNATHTLAYEAFLAAPAQHLRELTNFCELPDVADAALHQAAGQVNPARSLAFVSDPLLAEFYDTVRRDPSMLKFGY